MDELNLKQADFLIEIRGIYDGWSVVKLRDGRLLNRWPPGTRRHDATAAWIESIMKAQAVPK